MQPKHTQINTPSPHAAAAAPAAALFSCAADSTLLASGSADKNLKVWGLDFGDCHRSLFAHGDSVMQVAFVPNTHYVFTVGERAPRAQHGRGVGNSSMGS
jgi:WD40 repeat protein